MDTAIKVFKAAGTVLLFLYFLPLMLAMLGYAAVSMWIGWEAEDENKEWILAAAFLAYVALTVVVAGRLVMRWAA